MFYTKDSSSCKLIHPFTLHVYFSIYNLNPGSNFKIFLQCSVTLKNHPLLRVPSVNYMCLNREVFLKEEKSSTREHLLVKLGPNQAFYEIIRI